MLGSTRSISITFTEIQWNTFYRLPHRFSSLHSLINNPEQHLTRSRPASTSLHPEPAHLKADTSTRCRRLVAQGKRKTKNLNTHIPGDALLDNPIIRLYWRDERQSSCSEHRPAPPGSRATPSDPIAIRRTRCKSAEL